jgi:integrase
MSRRSNGEGSVYRRKDGRWVAATTLNDPTTGLKRRHSFYGKTMADAKNKRATALRAAEAGLPTVESRMTLSAYLRVWTTTHLPNSGRKQSTIDQYKLRCRTYIEPNIGDVRLAALTPLVIETFLGRLAETGLRSTSRRAVFNTLSAVLATAQRDGLIRRNPCTQIKRPRVDTAEATHLAPSQVQSVIAAVEPDLRPLLVVLSRTGLRISEALALQWSDIDLGREEMRVVKSQDSKTATHDSTKTRGSLRTLPLVASALAALREQRKLTARARLSAGDAWHDNDLVFPSSIGTPLTYSNVLKRYQAKAKPLGITGGFHTLRHSAATLLFHEGVPVTVVSRVLGHSRASITLDIYGHAVPGDTKAALESLNEALGS